MGVRRFAGLLALLLWLSCGVAWAAAPARLSFYGDVDIAGPEILLGDIAAVECADEARAAALRMVKLGNAPSPGEAMVLSARLFQLRLLAAGEGRGDIAWQMARPITVRTRAQQIAGSVLAEQAKAFVQEQLLLRQEERMYALEVYGEPKGLMAPEGVVRYELRMPYGIRYTVPNQVYVFVYINEQLYKKAIIRIRVHVYEPVVVAARALASRQAVEAADVRIEHRDVSDLAPGYFTDLEAVIGKVTRRMINDGAPLTEALLDKPVIMQRAMAIEIVSMVGGVQVRTEGEALQDGKEGEWIRVKNTRSGKVLSGRVVDATTVEISG